MIKQSLSILIFGIIISTFGFSDGVVSVAPSQKRIKKETVSKEIVVKNQIIQLLCPKSTDTYRSSTVIKYIPQKCETKEVAASKSKPSPELKETKVEESKLITTKTRDYFKNIYVGVIVGYGPTGLKRTTIDDEYGKAEVTKDVIFGGRVQYTTTGFSTGLSVTNNGSVAGDFLFKK